MSFNKHRRERFNRHKKALDDPTTPMSVLCNLAIIYPEKFMAHPVVRLQRATAPNWLFSLPPLTLSALVRSQVFPKTLIDRLTRERGLPIEARVAVATRSDLNVEQLRRLTRHAIVVRRELARNNKLPEDLQTQLACDRDSRVRAHIAQRTNSPAILQRLSRDRSLYSVRVAVAGNKACPHEARLYLSRSRIQAIQDALAEAEKKRSTA